MKLLLLSCLFLSVLPSEARGSDQTKVRHAGLSVEFKDKPTAKWSARDELHERLGTNLVYRSTRLPIDEVRPSEPRKLDHKSLRALCLSYRKSDLVSSCEIRAYIPAENLDFTDEKKVNREISATAPIAKNKCNLIDKTAGLTLHKGLSPFWAHEYIGADLARSLVEAEPGTIQVSIAQLDSGFSRADLKGPIAKYVDWNSPDLVNAEHLDHGTQVSNLLNAPSPIGVAAKAILGPMCNIQYPSGSYLRAADQIYIKQPKLVNLEDSLLCLLSGCWKDTVPAAHVRDHIEQMTASSIVVAAAGNLYPQGSRGDAAYGLNLIVVGSMNPIGWVSHFSDESSLIAVLAPSDSFLLSYGLSSGFSRFGGTSGATPLVTATLANVISIISELNFLEARALLEKTAFPLLSSRQTPQRNGAGMLNSLKLVEVAKRLKQRGWPKNRQQLLADESIFNFSEEASRTLSEAKRLLASSDCKEQSSGFKLARRAALLGNSPESFDLLARIYEEQDLPVNARFYRNLDFTTGRKEILASLFRPSPYPLEFYDDKSAERMARILDIRY